MTPAVHSRRQALAVLLGAGPWLPRKLAGAAGPAIRMGISESTVGDVNLNDARMAVQVWLKRLGAEVNLVIDPKCFSTTREIVERVRNNQLDVVAVNALEYRLIANLLDSSEIVTAAGGDGVEQYLILIRRNGGVRRLGDMKGRRLVIMKAPKTCLAPAWLSTLLDDAGCGTAEQFFGSITTESKFSRVILPVFFGQADACLTSRRGFATMSELNPQVGKELQALASSAPLVPAFYVFRRNYPEAEKARLVNAIANLRNGIGGQELATLFQFDRLAVMSGDSLTSALNLLDKADRAHARQSAGGRK